MTSNEKNSDAEDDYMSDVFLQKSESVRPGLVTGRLAKVYKQQALPRVTTKSLKTLQEESRQEGLNKEISSNNIGFKLLSKMGFKKDIGIGKKGTGIKEPISVVLKADRTGLGHSSAVKRNRQEKVDREVKRRRHTEEQWKAVQRNKASEVTCEKDLRSSQKACMQLDMAKGLENPLMSFYWPMREEKKAERDDDEEEEEEEGNGEDDELNENLSTEEMLHILNHYLRNTYRFCVWCGIKFEDEADLKSGCPGDTASCHDDI